MYRVTVKFGIKFYKSEIFYTIRIILSDAQSVASEILVA